MDEIRRKGQDLMKRKRGVPGTELIHQQLTELGMCIGCLEFMNESYLFSYSRGIVFVHVMFRMYWSKSAVCQNIQDCSVSIFKSWLKLISKAQCSKFNNIIKH